MNSWEELKNAVGKWASANFGSQNGLGCLVPLMGIGEEVGEWRSALEAEDEEGALDAIGDVLIFLMDYCYRAGVRLDGVQPWLNGWKRQLTLQEAVGELYHVQVKRLQRIRGMEDDVLFCEERILCIAGIIVACKQALIPTTREPLEIASNVFTTVVQKRKWHDAIDKPLTVESCTEDFQRVVKELNNL